MLEPIIIVTMNGTTRRTTVQNVPIKTPLLLEHTGPRNNAERTTKRNSCQEASRFMCPTRLLTVDQIVVYRQLGQIRLAAMTQ